jgi:N-dimethylarginine dimethylaminohydrolase
MNGGLGPQTMVGRLRLVAVKSPEAALAHTLDDDWRDLSWHQPIHPRAAALEHQRLVSILESVEAEVIVLGPDDRTGLDSIYTHDSSLVTSNGVVPLRTGKPQRRGEGAALADALSARGLDVLEPFADREAFAEGGDMTWIDPRTLIIGRGFRTNPAGIVAVRKIVEPQGVEVFAVDLPYWHGPSEVLHLMSFISMLDSDLAVIYSPMVPVAVFELLTDRGIELLEVPESEFSSQGCNVLALEPRHVVMLEGNPLTQALLEAAGCRVETYPGSEISLKGDGGPTCLTRPLVRDLPEESR